MHLAVKNNCVESVKLLLQNPRVEVNAKAIMNLKEEDSPFLLPIYQSGKDEIIKEFFKHQGKDIIELKGISFFFLHNTSSFSLYE